MEQLLENLLQFGHKYCDKKGNICLSALPKNYQNTLFGNSHNNNWDDDEHRFQLNNNYKKNDFMTRKWDNFINNHRNNIRYITYHEGYLTLRNVRIVNGPISQNGRFYIYFQDV